MQDNLFEKVSDKVRGHVREWTAAKIVRNSGVKLHVDASQLRDTAVIRALWFNKHERTEAALVSYAVKKTDRVLEIGSGLGFISLKCASICGPSNVVTFEGNPAMYALLKRNLELNQAPIDARQAVVTLNGGLVSFQVAESMVSSSLYERENATPLVSDSASFRSLVKELKPTVVIMDIEGSEVDLLGTCPVPGVRAIGVEIHPQIVGREKIDAMISRLHADGFAIDPRFPATKNRVLFVRETAKQSPTTAN